MKLDRFSFGIGDRFGCQGRAQLAAIMQAREQGVSIVPVWNKSNREHTIIGTRPIDVRREADEAVRACAWSGPYLVDADHIGFSNVDKFVTASDFFTLDVADFIAKAAGADEVDAFVDRYGSQIMDLQAGGEVAVSEEVSIEHIRLFAAKYLTAVRQAGKIYRRIVDVKGAGNFVTEVSMDETDEPQTPAELLVILAAIADEGIAAQTIAPKFTGRFNKGVDYVGDIDAFAREFEADLMVLKAAVRQFGLSENLKLSIHSGSDKFSLYGPVGRAIREHGAGLHVKTAGTTWLEELIGLALAGDDSLAMAADIYGRALSRFDELCEPYENVIDIDSSKLPSAGQVRRWDGERFAAALRHDPDCPDYDSNFRQLLHVGYKIAAEMRREYTDMLQRYEDAIAPHVTANLFERHIQPIFMA